MPTHKLYIDERVIRRAKAHADAQGMSVSDMVESYLADVSPELDAIANREPHAVWAYAVLQDAEREGFAASGRVWVSYCINRSIYIMATVKVFQSGNSQAVRLPKEFAVDADELQIRKLGDRIMLSPVNDRWVSFRESLGMFTEDVIEEGRQQPDAP